MIFCIWFPKSISNWAWSVSSKPDLSASIVVQQLLKNTSVSHTVDLSDTLLHYHEHKPFKVYLYSVAHTPSCCCKYLLLHQMCINMQLKIIPPKCTFFYQDCVIFKKHKLLRSFVPLLTGQLRNWTGNGGEKEEMTCSKGPQGGIESGPSAGRTLPLYMWRPQTEKYLIKTR